MRIQHNLSAMNSLSNYHGNNNALSNNLEKLSSGYRINSAADDAAGLAISEKMRSQIAGLEKAQDNANDGISLIQTAEGALTEVNSMLTRLKSLATQSANGTYEDGVDRANIQEETDALLSEIDRISQATNFNGINLLDGSLSGASEVSHLAVDETKSVRGIYQTANFGAATAVTGAFGLDASDKDAVKLEDIGKTIDYNVTWRTGSGEEKTTTVSLTFQGQGDGTLASVKTASQAKLNYFTDDIGNKYNFSSTGTLTVDQIKSAIVAGLKADEEFSSEFEISKEQVKYSQNNDSAKTDSTSLAFTSKKDGSAGAVMLSTSFKNNLSVDTYGTKGIFGTAVANNLIKGTGSVEVKKEASDNLQRFNMDSLTYVNSSATKDEIAAATFEIDGAKFLLVTNDFSDNAMKSLDADVTVIKSSLSSVSDGSISAANHTKRVNTYTTSDDGSDGFKATDLAALIQKQTGREVKAQSKMDKSVSATAGTSINYEWVTDANYIGTSGGEPGKTVSIQVNKDSGLRAGDIVFQDANDKLKLKGNQLDLQVGDTNKDYQKVSVKIQDMSSKGLGLKGLDLGTQEGAGKAIDTIQNAVNSVSMQRGQLGALQNRLEHTLNNLDATDQNITAAESQIRDVDMAKEMTQYSKNNILAQAAQSMLAQANSAPQGVLSLLG